MSDERQRCFRVEVLVRVSELDLSDHCRSWRPIIGSQRRWEESCRLSQVRAALAIAHDDAGCEVKAHLEAKAKQEEERDTLYSTPEAAYPKGKDL